MRCGARGSAKALGQRLEQLALGRGLGELARQRLARIGERVLDEILLLAALRHLDLDLVAALAARAPRPAARAPRSRAR